MKVEIEPITVHLGLDPRNQALGYRVQLARARRALKRLAKAPDVPLTDESCERILDDIFSAAVTLHHMRDWVGRETAVKDAGDPVAVLLETPVMMALRDLCDGGKHRGIDRPNRFPGPLMLHAEGQLGRDTERTYLHKIQLRMGEQDTSILAFLEGALKSWVEFCITHLGLPNHNGVPLDFTINDLSLNIQQALEFELSGRLPEEVDGAARLGSVP